MHGILQDVEQIAFQELSLHLQKNSTSTPLGEVTDAGDDHARVNPASEVVEANWHKVAGSRLLRLRRVVHCFTERFIIICLAVVTEPLRFLTHHFMALSSRVRDYGKWPPLFDILWGPMSPLVRVHQHFSTLLSGTSPRIRLILAHVGCITMVEWSEKFPEQVAFFRRLIICASALVTLRHTEKFNMPPWSLFAVGDRRRRKTERIDIVIQFKALGECCLPPGLSQMLHRLSQAMLTSATYETIFFFAAWEMLLSISVIEKLHAQNRATKDPRMSWHSFVANFVNREVPGPIG
jgi:hypothetical protein